MLITKNFFLRELIATLALPVILVTHPSLGTINHTLLTLDAARQKRIDLIGLVINYIEPLKRGLAERTNPEVLSTPFGLTYTGRCAILTKS